MALVVLDASVVIGHLWAPDAHHGPARQALSERRGNNLVLPASAYAEVLVAPSRAGRAAVRVAEGFIDSVPIAVAPVTREIGRLAARLRARHPSLRLPEALVLATGEALEADEVLTADARWPKFSRRVVAID